jgi:zinc transport system substrate-binding protein
MKPVVVVAVLAALATSACGMGENARASDGRLRVVASFYPLQWATQRVAGDAATVLSLTKPGAEPHDLELTPKAVAAVDDADLVVYLRHFQPAVDDAVDLVAPDKAFDVEQVAHADLPVVERGDEPGEPVEHAGTADPHFWLDPTRLADVGDAVAAGLSSARPAERARFAANAARLRADLDRLDAQYQRGLRSCANRELVTSHAAFGYLAKRYHLTQVGIVGLSAEGEPDPAQLSHVTDFVDAHQVSTIYYETLVSPAVAQTVARETGAHTAVLDPLEGLTNDSAGTDYLAVMRSNLVTLRAGQDCS